MGEWPGEAWQANLAKRRSWGAFINATNKCNTPRKGRQEGGKDFLCLLQGELKLRNQPELVSPHTWAPKARSLPE